MPNKNVTNMNKTKPKKLKNRTPSAGPKTANLAINNFSKSRPPTVRSKSGGTVVSHREIVREGVTVDSDFTVDSIFALQPAISIYSNGSPLGQWLPGVAQKYDSYTIEKMVFRFITSAASTQAGTIVLAFDPNPEANPPSTFAEARNMHSADGPARENLTLDVSAKVRGKKLLTRLNAVRSYIPYDAGKVFLSGFNSSSTSIVGYLEVEYTITFSNPQTGPNLSTSSSLPGLFRQQVYVAATTGSSASWNLGLTHTDANPNAPTAQFKAGTSSGHSLITWGTAGRRSYNLDFTAPSGVLYKCMNGAVSGTSFWEAFSFQAVGRYHIQVVFPGNWSDRTTFGAQMLRLGGLTGTAIDTDPIEAATDISYDSQTSTLIDVPANFAIWRGFKSGDVGPVEPDDLGMQLECDIYVADTTRRYFLACGVRPITGLSENNTASYAWATGSGVPRMSITFLSG